MLMAALVIFMRFLHIACAVTLVGGAAAWAFAGTSAAAASGDARTRVENAFAAAWRPFAIAGILGILISGIFNFLRKTGLTPAYHAIFGIKVLLALHVFAALILAARPDNPRRSRQLTGVVISGFLIVALSAVLRWLGQS
jgi:hypothetical protein